MDIFGQAKRIMRKDGNMKQWTGNYPSVELITKDIQSGNSYVCIDDEGTIAGTFTFIKGNDPTYALSLIHISEPTRLGRISDSVVCL